MSWKKNNSQKLWNIWGVECKKKRMDTFFFAYRSREFQNELFTLISVLDIIEGIKNSLCGHHWIEKRPKIAQMFSLWKCKQINREPEPTLIYLCVNIICVCVRATEMVPTASLIDYLTRIHKHYSTNKQRFFDNNKNSHSAYDKNEK